MSRIGKKVIIIPANVEVKIDNDLIMVKGPRGNLTQKLHSHINVAIKDKELSVEVANPEEHKDRALWGLFRSIINNMILGAAEGFEKKLEINGVGYKAKSAGKNLVLNVGYSHPVEFEIPAGINCVVDQNIITISGADKQLVGEVAAMIRKIRKPEPYKGKGIKYVDEILRRKEGKTSAKGTSS